MKRRAKSGPQAAAPASAAELGAACRAGDAEAWDQLVERYHQLVFAIASREGLSTEDAADVTQTTFEALLAQLDRIRDDSQIPSWLMTVARRQSWRVRDERARLSPVPSDSPAITNEGHAVDPIGDASRIMWVYQGLAELDGQCRDLITALYFEPSGPSYAEVASRLGRPVGSIGPTRARCLERLRKILGEVDWA